ncbi:hypothetical protein VNO77_14172 [Canavalia gladiata]|uniref:Uncharacterized protein n=1 Tax=Canavalia gladiata TaxID=3824 RepID=A0AAN9M2G3_CANGL
MSVMTTELREGASNLVPSVQNSDEWKLEHKLAALDRLLTSLATSSHNSYILVIVCASANPALFGEDEASETIKSMLWCERKTELPRDPQDGYTMAFLIVNEGTYAKSNQLKWLGMQPHYTGSQDSKMPKLSQVSKIPELPLQVSKIPELPQIPNSHFFPYQYNYRSVP